MERLTDKRLAIPPGQWQEVTREEARELKEIPVPPTRELYYRLSQIEDILCDSTDEYDLDRLRELAEADREGRVYMKPKALKCPRCGANSLVKRVDGACYYCFDCGAHIVPKEAEAALAKLNSET